MIKAQREELQGIGVSGGVVEGEIYIYKPYTPTIQVRHSDDPDVELKKYEQIKASAADELETLVKNLQEKQSDKAEIFIAQMDFLEDEEAIESINHQILTEHFTAQYAIHTTYTKFAQMLDLIDDEMIAARQADVMDVCNRMLRVANGVKESNLSTLSKPVIVAANDLLPSDTATLDRNNVLGIVTQLGNITSHTAIIAQNYSIPTILGLGNLLSKLSDGDRVILDASEGILTLSPEKQDFEQIIIKQKSFLKAKQEDEMYKGKPLITRDGVSIDIGVNIGTVSDEVFLTSEYTDYVGLFRTEFLFMAGTRIPTEQEQFDAYKKVLSGFGNKRIILRTIDIGGDKSVPGLDLPKEDNPFLGVRALRMCYENLDLFKTQLRAAFRASVFGKLGIMFPMVTSMDDIYRVKQIVADVKKSLDAENIPYSDDVELGIMIEVPSIALIADTVVKEVDFASIGTNDLCQYLTATDRLNSQASQYYQSFHPAMFRLISYISKIFKENGKELGVCGELGGDELGAPILVGLGVRKLSMSMSSVGRIKRTLSESSVSDLTEMASKVLNLKTQENVLEFVNKAMK